MRVLLCERRNSANQYVELLWRAYQQAGNVVIGDVQNFLFSDIVPDFVHLQWPEALYRWRHQFYPAEAGIDLIQERLRHFKLLGVPIVYTVHNRLPHANTTELDLEIYRLVCAAADIFVHHGHRSIDLLKEEYPECAVAMHIVCPHGPYPKVAFDPAVSRQAYALPEHRFVCLNFGRQRPNKGVGFVDRVFAKWASPRAILFTIGPAASGASFPLLDRTLVKLKSLAEKASNRLSRRRRVFTRSIDEAEIPRIMAAADIVFLGHLEGWNSGVIALAASYGKPVVFPDLVNFHEQIAAWPWRECYSPGDIDSAVAALDRMLKRVSEVFSPARIDLDPSSWAECNSWSRHVQSIVAAVAHLGCKGGDGRKLRTPLDHDV